MAEGLEALKSANVFHLLNSVPTTNAASPRVPLGSLVSNTPTATPSRRALTEDLGSAVAIRSVETVKIRMSDLQLSRGGTAAASGAKFMSALPGFILLPVSPSSVKSTRCMDRLCYCAVLCCVALYCFVVFVVLLTLTDPLRIQPWSQDRRNQTKSNRESEVSRESRQKRTDKKVASKGHRRDKIENTNKNTQTVETT